MSKGSRVITLRLPDQLVGQLCTVLGGSLAGTKQDKYGMSEFIRSAIVEKIRHRQRSKKSRRRETFVCSECKQRLPIAQLEDYWTGLLDGITHKRCMSCFAK